MEKLKPGLQKAELLIELLSKVFFISGTIHGECWLVCSRVQMARLTTREKRDRLERGGEGDGRTERQTLTPGSVFCSWRAFWALMADSRAQ